MKYYNPPKKPGPLAIFVKEVLHILHIWLCLVAFSLTLIALIGANANRTGMTRDQATQEIISQ